jgi:hypothetical protein
MHNYRGFWLLILSFSFIGSVTFVGDSAADGPAAVAVKDTPECRGLGDSLKIESVYDYESKRDPDYYDSIAQKLADELNGVLENLPTDLRDRMAAANTKLLSADQLDSLEQAFYQRFNDLRNRWNRYFFCPSGTKADAQVTEGTAESYRLLEGSYRSTTAKCINADGKESGVGKFVSMLSFTRPWKLQIYFGNKSVLDHDIAYRGESDDESKRIKQEQENKDTFSIPIWPRPVSASDIASWLKKREGPFKGDNWVHEQLAKKNCLASGQDSDSKNFTGKSKTVAPIQTGSQSKTGAGAQSGPVDR